MQYILDTSSGLAKLLFIDGLWIHVPLKVCFRCLLCNLASRFTNHMTVPTFGFVSTISACKYSDKTIIFFCDLMPYMVVDPIFKVQNLSSTVKMETEFSYKISLNYCQNANVTFQKTLSSIVIAMNTGCHIFYEFWLRNLVKLSSLQLLQNIRSHDVYGNNPTFLPCTVQSWFTSLTEIISFTLFQN
jgi:hypothetical protein